MTKTSKIVLFSTIGALILLAVIGYMKAKKWISQINYGIASGVKVSKITLQNVSVYVPIWFYNPTPFSFVVSDLDLKIYFNNQYVSSIISPSNYRLNSKVNSTYPLTINVKYADIIKLLAEQGTIINDPDWLSKIQVRIVGTVKIDTGILSLKQNINITDSLKYYVG